MNGDNHNLLQNAFSDKLKVEGLNFKGYGIIPKYVMLDQDLTLEAKGIYAYFCSFSGNGDTAFPSRDRILADLQISKDTYYNHFKKLCEQGYITVKQTMGERSTFSRNVYTLVSNPKKMELSSGDMNGQLLFSGVKALGYGMIPKAVMIDERLPLKAKALYAYFCSFTGAGKQAFPRLEQIMAHVHIALKAYYKYFNLLQECNYVTAVQRRVNGKLGVNDYYLNDMPDLARGKRKNTEDIPFGQNSDTVISEKLPFGQNQDTVISEGLPFGQNQDTERLEANIADKSKCSNNKKKVPFGQNSDTVTSENLPLGQKPDTVKSDTQKPDTQNQDTNINRITNNKLKSNIPSLSQNENTEGGREANLKQIVQEKMLDERRLPYEYHSNEAAMTEAIHFMTGWDVKYPAGYSDEFRQKIYNLFNEALIQMCMSSHLQLKGSYVTYSKVIEKINAVAEFHKTCVSIDELVDGAMENFYKAASSTEIRFPLRYMQSCIWDALLSGNIEMYSNLRRVYGI